MSDVNFTATDAVYERLALIMETEANDAIQGLRISIQGGGCSGFQYAFGFVENIEEDDTVIENDDGIKIAIDPMSMMYLEGATIDYVKTLEGEYFSITNPAARTSCGCGSSFTV